jgi:hypothetical protein
MTEVWVIEKVGAASPHPGGAALATKGGTLTPTRQTQRTSSKAIDERRGSRRMLIHSTASPMAKHTIATRATAITENASPVEGSTGHAPLTDIT